MANVVSVNVATGLTTTRPQTTAEIALQAADTSQAAAMLAAAQPAIVEKAAARADLQTQYAAAMARLDQIIAASAPTNAQVVAAVQDLARYTRVLARLNKAEFIGGG